MGDCMTTAQNGNLGEREDVYIERVLKLMSGSFQSRTTPDDSEGEAPMQTPKAGWPQASAQEDAKPSTPQEGKPYTGQTAPMAGSGHTPTGREAAFWVPSRTVALSSAKRLPMPMLVHIGHGLSSILVFIGELENAALRIALSFLLFCDLLHFVGTAISHVLKGVF